MTKAQCDKSRSGIAAKTSVWALFIEHSLVIGQWSLVILIAFLS